MKVRTVFSLPEVLGLEAKSRCKEIGEPELEELSAFAIGSEVVLNECARRKSRDSKREVAVEPSVSSRFAIKGRLLSLRSRVARAVSRARVESGTNSTGA